MSAISELIHEPISRRLSIPFERNDHSPQARGLVGWWPTVGASRSVLPGYAGSLAPMVTANAPAVVGDSEVGQMLLLNGSNQFAATIVGGLPLFQQTTPFSVAQWVRTTDTDAPFVSNWNILGTPGWRTDINNGSLRLLIVNAVASGRVVRTTATTYGDGNLYFFVATFSGNSAASGITLYVNGVAVAMTGVNDADPGTLVNHNAALGANLAFLAGSIADPRVYNRALSAAEVWQMYAPQTRWELYLPLVRRSHRVPAITTPLNADGAVTPTGALTRQANKPLAGSLTPAGLAIRAVYINRDGSITPAATVVKRTSKSPAGSIAPAGSLATLKVAVLIVAGAIAPGGALVRQINKALTAGLTPAGALAKALQRALSGSLTPAGALTAARVRVLDVVGSLVPAGALIRQVNTALSGAIVPTGALVRQVNKALGGSLNPSGALARLRVAVLTLAGSITPAGTLVKQVARALSGALTPAGLLTKQVNKASAGSLAPSGSEQNQVGKALGGALTPTGAALWQVNKVLSGTLAPVGSLTRLVGKLLAGLLAPVGDLLAAIFGGEPARTFEAPTRPLNFIASARPITFVVDARSLTFTAEAA